MIPMYLLGYTIWSILYFRRSVAGRVLENRSETQGIKCICQCAMTHKYGYRALVNNSYRPV